MQLLIIKFNGLEENPKYALLGKNQTQDTYTSGDWEQVRSLSRGRKVLVLLSSNEVVLTSISVPSKNRKQLLQAIPYALEDTVAEDIENLHFSVHQETDAEDNEAQVAIINSNLLSDTLEFLTSKKVTVNFILPELLTLNFEPGTWSVNYQSINEQISANVRLGQYQGFVSDQKMFQIFISETDDMQLPSTVFSNIKPQHLPKELQQLPTSYIKSDTINYDSAISALPLNLLTNFVRRNVQSSAIDWKAWRPAAILGGVLASVWIGMIFWQNNLLQQQSDQLKSQIELVYKDTFPQGRIVDASSQMNSALNKLKKNSGQSIKSPLPLISDIGPLLKEYKDMVLSELRFQENQLSMTIESPNLTRLESFKKDAAEKRNLKIEIKDSTTTANKVKAIIWISPLLNTTAEKSAENKNSQENS